MRKTFAVTTTALVLAFAVLAQDKAPEPKVSRQPLTAEQIAVYQAVLKDYDNGTDKRLNLANTTEPMGESEQKGCVNWVPESAKNSAPIVHRLDALAVANRRLILVDPQKQRQKIEENDPQKLLKSAMDGSKRVSKKQLDSAVENAFGSALFTFSEIMFDREHRDALLSYSFVCGGLCGHGNTLALQKSGQRWKITKRCGGWIS